MKEPIRRKPLSTAFWQKVDQSSDCWNWTGRKNEKGYGTLEVGYRRRAYAHRLSYEMLVGPIPDGLEIDHLCSNPSCVNPFHLEAVSHVENLHRGRGWAGRNFRKTHCVRGHEFTPENTIREKHGRKCRICATAARRRRTLAAAKKRREERG